MIRINYLIYLGILCSFSCLFQSKFVSARVIYRHEVDSLRLQDSQKWIEFMRSNCANELKEIENEIGKCSLHLLVNLVRVNLEQTDAHSIRKSHQTFTQPTNLHILLQCLCTNDQLHTFSTKQACINHATFMLQQSSFPRRSLADKDNTLDDSIIIPADVLFQPPPPPPEVESTSTSPEDHNNGFYKIIIVAAASVTGIALLLAILVLCCSMSSRDSVDKQRDDRPLLMMTSNGSSMDTDPKDLGRKTSIKGSNLGLDGQHESLSTGFPENSHESAVNAETLTSQNIPTGQAATPPPPAAPPPPPPKPKAPPPPPKGARPPPAPPLGAGKGRGRSASVDGNEPSGDPDAPRTKLKPFFWDKVVGSPNHSMVWDEIRAGSFQFNEEMIESLFGYNNSDDKRNGERRGQGASDSQPQRIQIIDPKKSQNLSIILKALNVTTEEVQAALLEGNELPPELLQTLIRMAPTQEEELKLRLYDGDLSQIGPAERFLKVMVGIPFAFRRMESLMFMMTFKEEVAGIKESFLTLEVACDELKQSRLFLKLLEAVLKTGNRMNDGTYRGGAQAFKLDTLLKLADVKGTDGKTTLLHFVAQEIIKAEGIKAVCAEKQNTSISSIKSDDFVEDPTYDETDQYRTLGLQIVSRISSELENVKKAAAVDADGLTKTVFKLGQSLTKIKNFSNNEMGETEEESGFSLVLSSFIDHSEGEVAWLAKEEERISELVRKTADYFHGNAGREEGLRLFIIVRDFLILLDKICAQLRQSCPKPVKNTSRDMSPKKAPHDLHQSVQDMRQKLFPAIANRRVDDSSSDSDSD